MSRHSFPGTIAGTIVALGWDRPLETFFVQVLEPDPDYEGEEISSVWQGAAPGELPTAACAITIAARYADLPANLNTILETDRLKTLGTSDGERQRNAKRNLFGP